MDEIESRYLPAASVQDALCQWYLPTVSQTPQALGTSGIVLWIIGSIITIFLFVMFCKQSYMMYCYSDRSFSRHLFGVTSMYVVMASLTSLGTIIPRSKDLCSAAKDIYMSLGISHFVRLTVAMYGGEKNMVSHADGKLIRIRKVPVCFCCVCIPAFDANRTNIKILKWITYQMKWTQAAYNFLRMIIAISQEDSIGVVPPGSNTVYLNVLNVFSFLPGVISLLCLQSLVRTDLQETYNYSKKGTLVRMTILVTKLQRLLFDILNASGVFPCYPPLVSTTYFKDVIEDFVYLVEVFILGVLTFMEYTKGDMFEEPSNITYKNKPHSSNNGQRLHETDFPVTDQPHDTIC